jgi:hypothetical protein
MRRLGNVPTSRIATVTEERPLLFLTEGKSEVIKINKAVGALVDLKQGDSVDILEDDTPGTYLIGKAIDAALDAANEELPKGQKQHLPGKKLSKSWGFTSTFIYPLFKELLKREGKNAFEVVAEVKDFDGIRWYKLVPTNLTDKELEGKERRTREESSESVETDIASEPEVPQVKAEVKKEATESVVADGNNF